MDNKNKININQNGLNELIDGKIVITVKREMNGNTAFLLTIQNVHPIECYYALSVARESILKSSTKQQIVMEKSNEKPSYTG